MIADKKSWAENKSASSSADRSSPIPPSSTTAVSYASKNQIAIDVASIRDRLETIERHLQTLLAKSNSPSAGLSVSRLLGPVTGDRFAVEGDNNSPVKPIIAEGNRDEISPPGKGAIDESTVNAFFNQNISKNGNDEVDGLKKQLEDKLRKAEVEMSIQRARVFQQKAELEEMKLKLEEREAAIRKSVDQAENRDPSSRWDRHFGVLRKKKA